MFPYSTKVRKIPETSKMYLFVPLLQNQEGDDHIKLELQLENEVGVGNWSKPFLLSLNSQGESVNLTPVVIPSIFLEETSKVQWMDSENRIVERQDILNLPSLDFEIEMFVKDSSGRLHHHAKVRTNQTIDLRFLDPGHYFIEFVYNGKRFVQHVIKQ